jgi:hypothetical protein
MSNLNSIVTSLFLLKNWSTEIVKVINYQSWTPPKHKKEDNEFSVDLSIFNIEDDKFYVDLKIFDTEDFKSSDTDNCCHHIKKMSTNI